MDQIIIGKFIASERKRKGYTQRQLADLLQISDKTISKWERGNGFPEVSLLLPLCRELDITVNELLSGERVSEEDYQKDYQQKAEENMVKKMTLQIGNSSFMATLENNPAVDAFVEMMNDSSVIIQMNDYSGFEKVGSLGTSLPADDKQTTTHAEDIVLYPKI